MPAESISWVDSTGPATLSNGKPDPATRFGNWTPDLEIIGPSKARLGSGRIDVFEFRRDDIVSFEIAAIPGTAANLALWKRLKYHLLTGGIVTLTSTRPLADEFVAYSLAENTKPEIDFSDRQVLEYTISLVLNGLTADEIDESVDIFSPAFIPGLKLWLDADDLTASNEDQDFISAWPDKSGNSNHAVQATFNRQPRYRSAQVNTHATVEFSQDAQPDYMLTPTIINPCTIGSTFFMVAKRTGAHVEHGNFLGFSNAAGSVPSDARIVETHGGDGSDNRLKYVIGSGDLGGLSTEWFQLTLSVASASSITPYYNGYAGAAFDPSDTLDTLIRVMVGGDSANSANSQIAEVLLYEGVISVTNRSRVHSYLANKYGILLGPALTPGSGALTVTGFTPALS